jgi:hypothetical protein
MEPSLSIRPFAPAFSIGVRDLYQLVRSQASVKLAGADRANDASSPKTADACPVAVHGVGKLSLRQPAAVLGTSYRMPIYHFDSKGGFGRVWAVERHMREAVHKINADNTLTSAQAMRQMCLRLSDHVLSP